MLVLETFCIPFVDSASGSWLEYFVPLLNKEFVIGNVDFYCILIKLNFAGLSWKMENLL